jgi:hypothetical protein
MPFRRNFSFVLAISLLGVLICAPPAAARPYLLSSPFAMLDGHRIPLAEVANYHCSDLAYPEIDCYTTSAARNLAVASRNRTQSANGVAGVNSLTSSGYVIAYREPSYAGSSVILSQDYSNLTSIGWNDVISSYKVFTSSGAFYQHAFYAGLVQTFCCFTNVPYVGSAYDNLFSSFDLP